MIAHSPNDRSYARCYHCDNAFYMVSKLNAWMMYISICIIYTLMYGQAYMYLEVSVHSHIKFWWITPFSMNSQFNFDIHTIYYVRMLSIASFMIDDYIKYVCVRTCVLCACMRVCSLTCLQMCNAFTKKKIILIIIAFNNWPFTKFGCRLSTCVNDIWKHTHTHTHIVARMSWVKYVNMCIVWNESVVQWVQLVRLNNVWLLRRDNITINSIHRCWCGYRC